VRRFKHEQECIRQKSDVKIKLLLNVKLWLSNSWEDLCIDEIVVLVIVLIIGVNCFHLYSNLGIVT
jgi:hypothetical protein